MIKCSKCKKEKEVKDFYKDAAGYKKNGLMSQCKECIKLSGYDKEKKRLYNIKYRKENKEKINELNKQWVKNNPEKVREIWRKRERKYKEDLQHKRKVDCRRRTRDLIKYNKITKKNICIKCYLTKWIISTPTQCHHEDYDNPYKFTELCQKCHAELHQKLNSKSLKII